MPHLLVYGCEKFSVIRISDLLSYSAISEYSRNISKWPMIKWADTLESFYIFNRINSDIKRHLCQWSMVIWPKAIKDIFEMRANKFFSLIEFFYFIGTEK